MQFYGNAKNIREWIYQKILTIDYYIKMSTYMIAIVQLHYIVFRLSLMKLPKMDFEHNYQLMN